MNKETYQYIGEAVVEHQEQRQKYNEEHAAEWKSSGEQYRKVREALNLSQNQIAERIGCGKNVISRFELGKNMKWRNVIVTGYKSAIEFFQLYRQNEVNSFLRQM